MSQPFLAYAEYSPPMLDKMSVPFFQMRFCLQLIFYGDWIAYDLTAQRWNAIRLWCTVCRELCHICKEIRCLLCTVVIAVSRIWCETESCTKLCKNYKTVGPVLTYYAAVHLPIRWHSLILHIGWNILVNLFFVLWHRVSNYLWRTKLVHGC